MKNPLKSLSSKINQKKQSIKHAELLKGKSQMILNLQSNKKQSKLKFNSSKIKDNQNLSISRLSKSSSVKSTRIQSNRYHIKLPNAFYNDEKTSFYLEKSKSLSQKSMCYQVWPLSFFQRKKFKQQSQKLQSIVDKRKTQANNDQSFDKTEQNGIFASKYSPIRQRSSIIFGKSLTSRRDKFVKGPQQPILNSSKTQRHFSHTQKRACQSKLQNLKSQKYIKLLQGSKLKQVQQKLLSKDISKIRSQKTILKKWNSPFKNGNSLRQKYEGQQIVSKSSALFEASKKYENSDPTQLKVLNIDRLFRKNKEGKLFNVVPLPIPKYQAVNARKNMSLITKNKDKIHDIIEQFNNLLRITKINKAKGSSKMIGIKGKNFTKNPTFEQLMGLKLKPKYNAFLFQETQEISNSAFLEYCRGYNQKIKQGFELSQFLISGLKQSGIRFNLEVLTRFYSIFVNKIATIEQKVSFFEYFFIPFGQQIIYKSQLIEILKILCKGKHLPSININIKTQTLSQEQKSLIFLQALIRVMFGEVPRQQALNREMLNKIFIQNQQAVELLLKLIQKNE